MEATSSSGSTSTRSKRGRYSPGRKPSSNVIDPMEDPDVSEANSRGKTSFGAAPSRARTSKVAATGGIGADDGTAAINGAPHARPPVVSFRRATLYLPRGRAPEVGDHQCEGALGGAEADVRAPRRSERIGGAVVHRSQRRTQTSFKDIRRITSASMVRTLPRGGATAKMSTR